MDEALPSPIPSNFTLITATASAQQNMFVARTAFPLNDFSINFTTSASNSQYSYIVAITANYTIGWQDHYFTDGELVGLAVMFNLYGNGFIKAVMTDAQYTAGSETTSPLTANFVDAVMRGSSHIGIVLRRGNTLSVDVCAGSNCTAAITDFKFTSPLLAGHLGYPMMLTMFGSKTTLTSTFLRIEDFRVYSLTRLNL